MSDKQIFSKSEAGRTEDIQSSKSEGEHFGNGESGERVFGKGDIIKVMYTNADSLSNKSNELQAFIKIVYATIICVTEALPKNMVGGAEYENLNFPDYVGFYFNRGAGVYIYIKSTHNSETFDFVSDFI